MKKTLIVILVLIMLLLPIGYIAVQYDKIAGKETVIGEVMYVDYCPFILNSQHHKYYVFLKPLGVNGGEDWIHFVITSDTICESEYSADYDKMTELTVGNIVQISYQKNELCNGDDYTGYKTLSIKSVKEYDLENVKNPNFSLKLNSKETDSLIYQNKCTVIHVSKVDSPQKGYIFYADSHSGFSFYTLERYWFDETLECYDEVERMVNEGLVGKEVCITNEKQFVFYNRNIRKGCNIGYL